MPWRLLDDIYRLTLQAALDAHGITGPRANPAVTVMFSAINSAARK